MNLRALFDDKWRLGWIALLAVVGLPMVVAAIIDSYRLFALLATATFLVAALYSIGRSWLTARWRLGIPIAAGLVAAACIIPLVVSSRAWSAAPLLVGAGCIYVAAVHTSLWGFRDS